MKLVFYSNFLNDHQLPLCQEFIELLGEGNFFFVAHQKISQERLDLGFEDMNEKYHFVIKSYKGGEYEQLAQRLMIEADVVIVGSYCNMPFEERMKLNKLTFRYNERILKKSDFYWFDPRCHYSIYKEWNQYKNKNLYTLCASAYTARDLSLFGYPRHKCFKWGYFPILREYNDLDSLFQMKVNSRSNINSMSILWVGRLIKWKYPDYAIKVASMLKNNGFNFKLDLIGVGELGPTLNKLIDDLDLRNEVHLLGALSPSKVREQMEKADVFLFTSDRNEGWGAVLNESLNSGCAVVANKAIGSVPFVLKHGDNGLVYNGTLKDLYNKVESLASNKSMIRTLGEAGYYTIKNQWNARVAAEKFVSIVKVMIDNTILTLS